MIRIIMQSERVQGTCGTHILLKYANYLSAITSTSFVSVICKYQTRIELKKTLLTYSRLKISPQREPHVEKSLYSLYHINQFFGLLKLWFQTLNTCYCCIITFFFTF